MRKKKEFKESVLPKLKEKFGYSNDLAVPRIEKIIISRGVNVEIAKSGSILEECLEDLTLVAGQKAVIRKAKKSIATFKIREGMPNGVMVTLRGDRMYAFLDRLISIASPRIRDFRGFACKGDGNGNITLGITDQKIFVEVENRSSRGFNITIVTTAKNNNEMKELLLLMGLPLKK